LCSVLAIIGILVIFLIWKEEIIEEGKKISFDKLISILSIVIALTAFIETSIQAEKNNIQFEENRKASDSLFRVQLSQAKQLNDLLISNSNKLNSLQIVELNKIQEINSDLTKSAENQLNTSKENLDLTKQSLNDYVFETRANLALGKSKIFITDTLDSGNLKAVITESVSNTGKRIAKNFEIRQLIVYNNGEIGELARGGGVNEVLPNEPKESSYPFTITKKEYENFFYWVQLRYYDERLDEFYDRSKYFHYYKTDKGYDFYYVKPEQKNTLRKIIDKELNSKGLSQTID